MSSFSARSLGLYIHVLQGITSLIDFVVPEIPVLQELWFAGSLVFIFV